jgi:hypothetical protein
MRAAASAEAEAVHGLALFIHAKSSASFVTRLSTTDPYHRLIRLCSKTRCTKQKWPVRRPLRHPTSGWLPAAALWPSRLSLPPDSERDSGQIHPSKVPGGELVARVVVPSAIEESPSVGTGGSFLVCQPKYGTSSAVTQI